MNQDEQLKPKQQLANFVEQIFKRYSASGLHICDIATGGGKSYTIGKLTCEYYPKYFDRIIILCVQNKLVDSMYGEIEKFIDTPRSEVKREDITKILNNSDLIKEAINNGSFTELLDQMDMAVAEQKMKGANVYKLRGSFFKLRKMFLGLESVVKLYGQKSNEYIQKQIEDGERDIRRQTRTFFYLYKQNVVDNKQAKDLTEKQILNKFPALEKVYPQVAFRYKKVLLMTVHKAMYGIDPILTEKFQLSNFPKGKNKRTLILFDESDQEAIAMRDCIINQAIQNSGGSKRFARGYNGLLQYKDLLNNPERITTDYYKGQLEKAINIAKKVTAENWKKVFGDVDTYNSILLDKSENIENYRRGVFFCGPTIRLNVSQKGDTYSFICYHKGDKSLTLAHSKDKEQLKMLYDVVVPLSSFLSLVNNSTTFIKSQLSKVIRDAKDRNAEEFNKLEKQIADNKLEENHYLGYPTLEREIHTLFSRFESPSEYQFEQQMNDYMTNRKNMILQIDGESKKLPDYSVYTQGVQLYQEELDEMDNLHRIRLSCREIDTTPEKIITDLVTNSNISVVLCSATSSNRSVVSNIDIDYLKLVLGKRVHTLSETDRNTFDSLVAQTYPNGHKVDIVPIIAYEYPILLENKITLPEKYKVMFSEDAQSEGLPEKWFKQTKQYILLHQSEKNKSKMKDLTFQLDRYFQFIEAYHFFITHEDIHSMIYFQNRRGDRDKVQIMILSSLIDGSYKDMSPFDDELPKDWTNNHIEITSDWENIQNQTLAKLSGSKDAKLMLVAAYGSFKAGANMQYKIPEGLHVTSGDNWETDGQELKKDWDAMYLQSPTNYLTINDDGNEMTYEKSLYNAMLSLMMLFDRGCLNMWEVRTWLNTALTGNFFFNAKDSIGIIKDKASWAQTVIEQAVGRLCRTRNKPETTYILYDTGMEKFFYRENMNKSLTKEFRTLADSILSHDLDNTEVVDADEIMRCNKANEAKRQLSMLRSRALQYTVHKDDDENFDIDVTDEDVPRMVSIAQTMNQSYKQTIIRKPVISDFDELDDKDKQLTFITKCYGDWERDENNSYTFHYDGDRICASNKGKAYPNPISPSSVRLDVLMNNKIIRDYFIEHGYATDWKPGKYILHPEILSTDYCGEIGEEAFKALVLHFTNCKENDFAHLKGRDYELADFVITNPDGSYRIAFDVKNMNPHVEHNDLPNDLSTTEKREKKKKRLGCELITVNLLEIKKNFIDETHEIGGLINENGEVIPNNMDRIIHLING